MKRFALPLAAACVMAVAAPVLAQEGDKAVPAVEISGGYGFAHDFDLETATATGQDLPLGWYFSTAGNLTRWLAVVGEIAGSHNTEDMGFDITTSTTVFTGLGGPRFFHKSGRFIPYGQVLFGVAWLGRSFESQYRRGERRSDMYFAVQPGGGVSIYFNSRVGAHIGADYRWTLAFLGEEVRELRLVTGVAVAFGSR